MAKQEKVSKSGKTGRFVVGRAGFAKISAVEGIRPTTTMKKRERAAHSRGLTAAEYRRMIIRSYRKD